MTNPDRNIGSEYAVKAAEVADKLRPSSYESVQSLALISIASSLARIAEALDKE
jgi:hypothetical protein